MLARLSCLLLCLRVCLGALDADEVVAIIVTAKNIDFANHGALGMNANEY